MDDGLSDESLEQLVNQGIEEVKRDPELTELVRQQLVLSLDDLVIRITEELERQRRPPS